MMDDDKTTDSRARQVSSESYQTRGRLGKIPLAGTATWTEVLSWAMFDFANSGFSNVVSAAVFNAYFVSVVAGGAGGFPQGTATLLWSLVAAISNGLVVATAPIIGTIADHRAWKKGFLAIAASGCALSTALLAFARPGLIVPTMILVITAAFMYGTAENLISAFLPEIADRESMGRISALGWTIGYTGGLITLSICLGYVGWAQHHGQVSTQYVPVTMLMVAAIYALTAAPSLLWLQERACSQPLPPGQSYVAIGFTRLKRTLSESRRFTDLFRFLLTMLVYCSGTAAVIVMAAVYAQQVMGFTTKETITLILVVNISAAIGAYIFGHLQDKFGSLPSLKLALIIWLISVLIIGYTSSTTVFWITANLIGIGLGAIQAAGRALVGQFSPPGRSAEFFGMWGLAGKLASIIGPVNYGIISYVSHGNHRLCIQCTALYFLIALVIINTINESRGKQAALFTE